MTIISCMYAIAAMDAYNIVQQYKMCVFNFIIHITVTISHLLIILNHGIALIRVHPDHQLQKSLHWAEQHKHSLIVCRASQCWLWSISYCWAGRGGWPSCYSHQLSVELHIEQGYSHLASTSTVGVTSILPVTSNHINNNNLLHESYLHYNIIICCLFISCAGSSFPIIPCVYTFLYCHPYFTHQLFFYACIISLQAYTYNVFTPNFMTCTYCAKCVNFFTSWDCY